MRASPSRAVLWVFLGAMVGTGLRVGGVLLWPPSAGGIPWITLAENLTGAFALGLLMPWMLREAGPAWIPLFLATGLLGAYTTFSALALESALLLLGGAVGSALLYLGLSLFLGPPVALLGWSLGTFRDSGPGGAQ